MTPQQKYRIGFAVLGLLWVISILAGFEIAQRFFLSTLIVFSLLVTFLSRRK